MKLFLYILFLNLCFSATIFSAVATIEDAFKINTSGILAQRFKMTVIAQNVANLMTLKDEETGLPYQKQYVVLEASDVGVSIEGVERSTEPFSRYFDPAAPQSDENGYFYFSSDTYGLFKGKFFSFR